MQRFCFTLTLRPDADLIAEYVELHRQGDPQIDKSIRDAGVLDMQIFLHDTQLFMIMDTTDQFTLEHKATMDRENAAVMAWEKLMSRFQDVAEESDPGTRWRPLAKIYQLAAS